MKEKKLPKYKQVKQDVLSWIQDGTIKADELIPSEHQLSRQFSLSRQTVRQAIGELEQEGWLYRKQGKGTFVSARAIGESKTIGIMTTYISDYIFPHIVRGAELALREHGYRLLLFSTDNDKTKEKECLQQLLKYPLSGLIIEPTKSAQGNPNIQQYLSLEYQRIPFVMINERYPEMQCPCIKVDDEQGGFLAAEHLIRLGHTRIAGFFKMDDLQGVQRLKGFMRAHKTYRVPLHPEQILHYTTEEQDNKPLAYSATLLEKPDAPTAFVCYNDKLAVRLLGVIRTFGLKVPEDISLTGFDDSPLATATEVKLTTLTHPKQEMGKKAAALLLQLAGEQDLPSESDNMYTPELIIRESTSNPKVD